MRNSLPVKKEPSQGTYIPLKHAIMFIILIIAIPPGISWVKSWINQEGEKRNAEIREVVIQTLQQQTPSMGSQQIVSTQPDSALMERLKRVESLVASLQKKVQDTPQYGAEIDKINKDLSEFNTRLLILADEVDKVSPAQITE